MKAIFHILYINILKVGQNPINNMSKEMMCG